MTAKPRGWKDGSIAFLGGLVGGKTPSKAVDAYWKDGDVPWVSPKDMKVFEILDAQDHITKAAVAQASMNMVPKGSVLLVTRSGILAHTLPVAVTAIPVTINQDIKAIHPGKAHNSRFLAYALRALQSRVLNECSKAGTTVASVDSSRLERLPIPLAPLVEQKRIADRLDTVLARVDSCRDRLAGVAPLLKRFRQSVLAAATSGRLTEDWRGRNAIAPGSAEREVQDHELTRTGSLRVRGNAARVDEAMLYDLPESWAWLANHRLACDEGNAICAGPFGTIFKAKDFRQDGVPIIFLRHVGEGAYLKHKPGFMDTEVWRQHHQPYSVYGGELLVTKLGDPPGTACIFPEGGGPAMVTPDVMKMNVDEAVADVRYLMHFFNGPLSKKIVEAICFGVTRLRIDLSMFKTFPIPLPPRAEQTEIVRRVEALFAFADRLEARLSRAATAVDRLTPALLAKAFRGELVSQDLADEAAGALLQRLAEPSSEEPRQRGRPRRAASVA